MTLDITPAQPSPLDFFEPLSFKNDAHECLVEEMAADKEQSQSAPPSTLLQNHSPTWISLVSRLSYPTAQSRKHWVFQCLTTTLHPHPYLRIGRKREHNGPKKKGGLTSNTNDKRRKRKKLHFGSPRHKSPKEYKWRKHHIQGESLVP
jgi:hypothetical protein